MKKEKNSSSQAFRLFAVDPGKNGAIAALQPDGEVSVVNMPDTAMDVIAYFREQSMPGDICYMEEVHGMPGQSGTAMFNFGKNFGVLVAAVLAAGVRLVLVRPQQWQKLFSVGSVNITTSHAEKKREHKRKLKERAQQLFPDKKVTLINSDALLILYYAKRKEN